MRRVGRANEMRERSGGGGKLGVDGTGSGFDGGATRRRGVRRGSLAARSDDLAVDFDCVSSADGISTDDGMLNRKPDKNFQRGCVVEVRSPPQSVRSTHAAANTSFRLPFPPYLFHRAFHTHPHP